jgi:hypothetical protein
MTGLRALSGAGDGIGQGPQLFVVFKRRVPKFRSFNANVIKLDELVTMRNHAPLNLLFRG